MQRFNDLHFYCRMLVHLMSGMLRLSIRGSGAVCAYRLAGVAVILICRCSRRLAIPARVPVVARLLIFPDFRLPLI